LAVDGNKNTRIAGGSCSSTLDNDTSPWWAVDLGLPAYVYGINLTNAADGYGK
jgi:hypothetical protein